MLRLTNVFRMNAEAYASGKYKYVVNQGGSRSSKTFSILQLIFVSCLKHKLEVEIVSSSIPKLKDGAMKDLQKIAASLDFEYEDNFNKTDRILKMGNGSTIKFNAYDSAEKAHGSGRDILYINEANHVPLPIADQLMMRTTKCTFIDFNPTARFWAHDIVQKQADEAILIKSTYRDNEFCPPNIVQFIESKKGDGTNNYWRVYGLGEIGISEGLVFNNWEVRDFDKSAFAQYRNGVDWGFSNDPFAYVRLAVEQDTLYVCEELYQRELLNKESAPLVAERAGREAVYCDSAEPKSVAEYKSLGVNAWSVKKGAGSIESGIKKIQGFSKVVIHPDCVNVADEFANYQWKVDKTGKALPTPVENFNHAIDAIRYALENDMRYTNTKVVGMRPF